MPHFANLPDFGGTIDAYGIDPMMMPISDGLLPGGDSLGANVDPMWIMPGSGFRPKGLAGLGALAASVPGGFAAPGNFNQSANTNTMASSQTQSSNITIQAPAAGGMLSGDSAPYVLALGGLGLFGLILWNALKG